MLKKSITFNDLDGNPITEDFYFNLTKAEALEVNFSHKRGLEEHVRRIIAAKEMGELIKLFKELILMAVGRRSDDGRRFIKSQEIIDDFVQTEAYSTLFMELATDADFASQFMNGIMPADIQEAVKKQQESGTDIAIPESSTATVKPVEPAWITEGRTPTPDEVKNATPEQLRMAFTRKQADQATPPVA